MRNIFDNQLRVFHILCLGYDDRRPLLVKMPIERLAILAAVRSAKRAGHDNNSGGNNGTLESDAGTGNNAIEGYNDMSNSGNGRPAAGLDNDLNGSVNVLLGGAMMSGVIIFVLLLCYCCHRSVRKHRPQEYSRYWRAEPDIDTLRVFTTHSMLCHGQETTAATNHTDEEAISLPSCPSSLGPPPTYDSLIFDPRHQHRVGGVDDALLSSAMSEKKHETSSSRETVDSKSGGEEPATTSMEEIQSAHGRENNNNDNNNNNNNEGLPSYEVALKLEANGYV